VLQRKDKNLRSCSWMDNPMLQTMYYMNWNGCIQSVEIQQVVRGFSGSPEHTGLKNTGPGKWRTN